MYHKRGWGKKGNMWFHNHERKLTFITLLLLFVGGVRPVCLPSPTESFPDGADCWITGWGYVNENTGALHWKKDIFATVCDLNNWAMVFWALKESDLKSQV